jgi:2-keto-4-pentenoate hydratase/2-oxohepta-3-ene-1,7-dioic acid hydratase in catechol pathway
MKIARFGGDQGETYGFLRGAEIHVCHGEPFAGLKPTGAVRRTADTAFLTPCRPTKMVAIWRNSRSLIEDRGERATSDLCWVLKPPSSFAGTGDAIVLPGAARRVIFEAELGVVIGRRCRKVSLSDAPEVIAGWTAVNEVTATDIVQREPLFQQHGRAKGFDTFGVFGPVIETELDLDKVAIRAWQNGELRQDFGIGDFVRHPYQIVSELSHDMTLEPGDVIACGSSLGVAPLASGDVVRIEISGVGRLENPVTTDAPGVQ